MIFKGNISSYICLLKFPPTRKNTKFIPGKPALKAFIILYLSTRHYEPW